MANFCIFTHTRVLYCCIVFVTRKCNRANGSCWCGMCVGLWGNFCFCFFVGFFLVYFCCNFGRKWVSLRCITYILVYAFTLYLLQRRLNVLWRIVVSLHVRVCMCVCACVSTCIYFELFIIMMGALIAYKVCIHILLFAYMLRWTFMTYLTPIICG